MRHQEFTTPTDYAHGLNLAGGGDAPSERHSCCLTSCLPRRGGAVEQREIPVQWHR